eukprot:604456-Amphidinium_carterae.2
MGCVAAMSLARQELLCNTSRCLSLNGEVHTDWRKGLSVFSHLPTDIRASEGSAACRAAMQQCAAHAHFLSVQEYCNFIECFQKIEEDSASPFSCAHSDSTQ